MKKYFMVGVMSLAVCTAAQAMQADDYDTALNDWQQTYPIIRDVRQDRDFQTASTTHLAQHSSAIEVLKAVLKEVIPTYIPKMQTKKYYLFVEGLDPVYRDAFGLARISRLLPTVGPDMYKVHDLFTPTHAAKLTNSGN